MCDSYRLVSGIDREVGCLVENAARHGKAHGARVTLKQQDGALNLEIYDDGVGFELGPQPDRTAGDGLGLTGMRERAEHLNGSLRVQSAPGKGTTISVQVPLKAEERTRVANRA